MLRILPHAARSLHWSSAVLILFLCLFAIAGHMRAAPFALYTDDFTGDLSIWHVTGAWNIDQGMLKNNGQYALATMGRRDWANYALDVRLTVDNWNNTGYIRLLSRYQPNGDAFGLELTVQELRLISIDNGVTTVLAHVPVTMQTNQPHLLRLAVYNDQLIGQLDLNTQITITLDANNQQRTAGQVGILAQDAWVSIDALEVLYMDSAALPRSNLQPDPGFLPPGTEQSAYARDIMLIYSGYYANNAGVWDMADAMPYLAYGQRIDGKLEFTDWFFDTFLFLGLQAPSGRAFDSPQRAAPSNLTDWQWYQDTIFQENKQLGAFNAGLESLKVKLADPDYKAKVIIMIPHATPAQRNFGDVDGDGVSEDFSPLQQGVAAAEEARWKAVRWYIDEVEKRWQEAGYAHLELIGYYWLDEHLGSAHGLSPDELVRRTSDYIHSFNRKLFWIPYFRAQRYEMAYGLGMDTVIMQPNYMFDTRISVSRFADTVATATKEYFGIEIEADDTVLQTAAGRERYLNYLRAGVTYGYMQSAIHAYYQGAKVFLSAFLSSDPQVRAIYDATYAFVKGRFSESLPK